MARTPAFSQACAGLIGEALLDPDTSWAIGTFGAIAEFHREPHEPVVLSRDGATTGRGGLRIAGEMPVRVVAWERPTAADGWTQGIALCLDAEAGAMHRRRTITHLGPDRESLTAVGRDERLFDLGIGAPHCDACVRSADPELLHLLETHRGRSVLNDGLLGEIARHSPTRVFLSRLGRVEVHTPIPKPGGRTPDGPHTHVLPDLLRLGRAFPANLPMPRDLVPGLEIFPPSAIHDAHGRPAPFNAGLHERFQAVLAQFGDEACNLAKAETCREVRSGEPPRDRKGYTRAQRLARRVALRQLARTDGPSAALSAWRAVFDRAGSPASA